MCDEPVRRPPQGTAEASRLGAASEAVSGDIANRGRDLGMIAGLPLALRMVLRELLGVAANADLRAALLEIRAKGRPATADETLRRVAVLRSAAEETRESALRILMLMNRSTPGP